jgi:hypothetical protein
MKAQNKRDRKILCSVVRTMRGLREQEFFGILELEFEAGHIVSLRTNTDRLVKGRYSSGARPTGD